MTSYISTTRTVGEVLVYVQRQFGDESGVQITNDDILRWINAGQEEIFRRSEPLKATTYANIVAGQKDYVLPPNVLRVQAIYVNGIPVEERSTQQVEEYILHEDPQYIGQGQPVIWSEWGGTFSFYPTPDRNSTNGMTLKYVKLPVKAADITSTLSIPDAYYNRLIEYVLGQAYELDENLAAAAAKNEQFDSNLGQQQIQNEILSNTYPTITILEEDL
jgi:hypothetical protein